MIYLDNAASTAIHPEVIKLMAEKMGEHYANASSSHALGRKCKGELENARRSIAENLGCLPGEIYFTSGGTESDNIIIKNAQHLGCKSIITSKIEHHAVLYSAEKLETEGLVVKYVNVLPNGHIDMSHLAVLLAENPNSLVSIMHANNEIGNLIDLKVVGDLCKQNNALFHSDTVQTIGLQKINLSETPVDFIVGSAHKFNGPKGIGFLYKRNGLALKNITDGGSQEKGLRCGTENLVSILGMAKALEIATANLEKKHALLRDLQQTMAQELINHIPGVQFNGDLTGACNPSVLSVAFPKTEIDSMMLFNLDLAGICASAGSACHSGSNIGSHVIAGVGSKTEGQNIRFSFGIFNTKEEIIEASTKIAELINGACVKA
jgi:cysteine desulfurase